MDFNKFEDKFNEAITPKKIAAWKILLTSAHTATKEIRFGNYLHRWKGQEGLIGLYTNIGKLKKIPSTITIHVRMGGLNIGRRTIKVTGKAKSFTPRFNDKSTETEIRRLHKTSRNLGEFLTKLREARKTLFRDISKEHWVESQLLLLANNSLAKRAGIKDRREAFKNMAPIGLGLGKAKIPFQLPVPVKFDHESREFPKRPGSWGFVDAMLYSGSQKLFICEVKDPGSLGTDKDEPQAMLQAYSYTRCIRDYGGEEFRKISCMSRIRKYHAVAVVGDRPDLIQKLKRDAKEIFKYEMEHSPSNPIIPKILTYSASKFISTREALDFTWLEYEH